MFLMFPQFQKMLLFALALSMGSAASAETLLSGGTGNALETLRKLGTGFAKKEHSFQLTVLPSLGSGGAIKGMAARSLDLGVISRPLKASEKSPGLEIIPLARTPLVIATNRRQEQAITTRQLVDIYGGKASLWPDGASARLVLRPLTESDTQLLGTLAPEMKTALDAAHGREGMVIAVNDQEAADNLGRLPGSLGTSTLSLILSEGRPLNALSLNGVPPALKGKPNPDYPLTKPLYLLVASDAKPAIRRFVAYIQSVEGRTILEKNGFLHGTH